MTLLPKHERAAAHERARKHVIDHVANLTTLIRHAWNLLDCESTPADMGALLTAEQMSVLYDAEQMIHDLRAAKPRLTPATAWRTPTEVRRDVALATRERSEPAITRGRRGRRR